MEAYDYVLFGEIQEVKKKNYEQFGRRSSFQEAVEQLLKEGKKKHGAPEIPDFLSWNLQSYRKLRELAAQIPVALESVLDVQRHVVEDVMLLSTKNRVQIAVETCYAKTQMIAIDYFSVTYVLEGSCNLLLRHGTRTLQPGEVCILPPHTPFAVLAEPKDIVLNIISEKTHFKEYFSALLYRENILSAFFRKALFENKREPIFFMLPPTKDIRSVIQHLFAEFVQRDLYSDVLFHNYLQIFYTNIIRSTEETYAYYSKQKKVSAKILMPAILKYITKNYRTLSLEELASHFHYESTYISKMIKLYTGKNYMYMITELKCKEAAELLRGTDKSMEEIAETVGYQSADHFAYSFKKFTGQSPREYRKSPKA